MFRRCILPALFVLVFATAAWPQARGAGGRAGGAGRGTGARSGAPADPFFVSTLPAAELHAKQAVVETSLGTMVFDLLDEAAPNHVAHFITRAREGAYNGTTFHRVITMGIIQGGDPLSKDAAQAARYGTGGLNELRFEANPEKHTRGAVSAVLVPGKRDSAGNQFFISVSDQPGLDGQYTVFARVAEGIAVAQKISTVPADGQVPKCRPTDRCRRSASRSVE
jgi:cyclophilin family peptidyl-prolyl cis-trans isomerase